MRVCLLRQNAPPTGCWQSNAGFPLLSVQRVRRLPFWWRANLQQCAGPRQHPGDGGLVRSFQATHEPSERRTGPPGQNQEQRLLDNLETLRSQKAKLEHAVERLIDSFAEGLIEKDQFASRVARTKTRIADLDTRIKAYAGDLDHREHLRLASNRLRELAATVGPELGSADWQRRREIIRTVVQRIDIDIDVIKIIFRVNENKRVSDSDAIAITFPRSSKRFRYSAG